MDPPKFQKDCHKMENESLHIFFQHVILYYPTASPILGAAVGMERT
jgi:hypothetical protein